MKRNIIITGGAGFIGNHVVRLFVNKYPEYNIINLDKLTYAGNLANLKDVEDKPNYKFVKMDICDFEGVYQMMQNEHVDGIIHLAAESHVDRSIKDPFTFAQTNVMGTLSLLQAAKLYWESLPEKWEGKRFYHISTDEVYGALQLTNPDGIEPPFSTKASSGKHHLAYGTEFFTEDLKYQPHSPYSAAKAASDHFVRAFHDTYGMPTIITNCSNNYGPYQFPEKLIPLFINNIRTVSRCPSTARVRTCATGSMSKTTPVPSTPSSTMAAWLRPTTSVASTSGKTLTLCACSSVPPTACWVDPRVLTTTLSPSSPTVPDTTCATPSTAVSSNASWVGSLRCNSKKASKKPCAGILTTKRGWTTSLAVTI